MTDHFEVDLDGLDRIARELLDVSGLQEPQLMIDGEARAYDLEIARAQANGLSDLANALDVAKQERIAQIKSTLFPPE